MSLSEKAILRHIAQGTTSITVISVPLVFAALFSGVVNAGPLPAEKPEVFRIIEVSAGKSHLAKIVTWIDLQNHFQARTALGKRLLSIRNRAIEKGMPLLDAGDI